MLNNPYKKYQKTQVTTASREKILLMLYEGAIRFTKQARSAMKKREIAEKGKFISKATAIISELMATLDFKQGGKLAADLENLYVFMIDKLIEGNINNDPECLQAVEDLLVTLYSAWKDVIENPRADGVPSKELQPELYAEYVSNGSRPLTTATTPAPGNQQGTAAQEATPAQTKRKEKDVNAPQLKVIA